MPSDLSQSGVDKKAVEGVNIEPLHRSSIADHCDYIYVKITLKAALSIAAFFSLSYSGCYGSNVDDCHTACTDSDHPRRRWSLAGASVERDGVTWKYARNQWSLTSSGRRSFSLTTAERTSSDFFRRQPSPRVTRAKFIRHSNAAHTKASRVFSDRDVVSSPNCRHLIAVARHALDKEQRDRTTTCRSSLATLVPVTGVALLELHEKCNCNCGRCPLCLYEFYVSLMYRSPDLKSARAVLYIVVQMPTAASILEHDYERVTCRCFRMNFIFLITSAEGMDRQLELEITISTR